MYGYAPDEMIGRPLALLIPPDRQSEIPELLEIIKRGRGINRYESERIRKSGGQFEVSASLSPIRDLSGNIVGVSTITRDITLPSKARDQLLDHATHLETLNLVAQDVASALFLNEVIPQALQRLVSASGFDFAYLHIAEEESVDRKFFAASREPLSIGQLEQVWVQLGVEFEQCFWSCHNAWFVEDVAATPEVALSEDHLPVRALAVLPLNRDPRSRAAMALLKCEIHPFAAEQKHFLEAAARQIALAVENARLYHGVIQANEKLRLEIEERQRAEKTLTDFTAMVVHDLRSPLSNVVSMTESVRDGLFGAVNEQQEKWLWKIQTNCRSLIDHVSDFLDFAKIDAGKLDLNREPSDLAARVRDSLMEFSIEAEKRNIQLHSHLSDRLPIISADPRRLSQVLANLLSNALKFTDRGGQIDVDVSLSGDRGIVIAVRDSGVGIPAEELDGVFEMYRQLSTSRQTRRQGTGLGLAICKKIVEAHGGRIWVESEEGKGASFFFSLPVGA
jgi:PAS domain S-box-containing protein